jgi:multimeric flavodoxin WrbA
MATILGFNGSPRPKWNTAQLIRRALEGAASQGARTEYFDLNSINFKPCQSCLICKKGPKYEGKCYVKDGLTPILEKIKKCDGFVVGFPIYMGLPSSLSHVFLERATFSNFVYRNDRTVYGKKIKTGVIVTTGAPAQAVQQMYIPTIKQITGQIGGIFGSCEWIGSYDTVQVDDYSQYDIQFSVPADKIKHRKEQFPIDLQAAYDLGKRLASK